MVLYLCDTKTMYLVFLILALFWSRAFHHRISGVTDKITNIFATYVIEYASQLMLFEYASQQQKTKGLFSDTSSASCVQHQTVHKYKQSE